MIIVVIVINGLIDSLHRGNSRLVFGDDDNKLKALAPKIGQGILFHLIFLFMKNFNFVALFIAIVAPIVKLCPSWALKFTKKSNRFAESLQLSAIKEENYLLKHQPSTEWIGERIWHLQTRKYFFKLKDTRPALFEAFISNIDNRMVFDVAYEIVPEEAIKAKAYTLDAERVIKACNDNMNYLYILTDKQPQSFTVSVVRALHDDIKEAYFSYLFTKHRWEKLAELDIILFEEAEKIKVAKSTLSFLMGLKDYVPRLSAEQLVTLEDKFEKWCQNANPFVVAGKMAEYWCRKQNFQTIHNTLCRMLNTETENTQKRNDWASELLKMLAGSEFYAQAVGRVLDHNIACPLAFKFLLDQKDEDNIELNLTLCINQKVEDKISEQDFDRFNNILKERLLVALAEDSMLSKEMLAKAPNYTIENLLLDILEEQAQVKWFEPLLGYTIKDEDLKILLIIYLPKIEFTGP